jgi:hypothetical protein
MNMCSTIEQFIEFDLWNIFSWWHIARTIDPYWVVAHLTPQLQLLSVMLKHASVTAMRNVDFWSAGHSECSTESNKQIRSPRQNPQGSPGTTDVVQVTARRH